MTRSTPTSPRPRTTGCGDWTSCASRRLGRCTEHETTCAAAEWLAKALGRRRPSSTSRSPTGGHPVVYAEWLGPGRSDRPGLRPLRRPAGRPARPVDVAAVRAGRGRRPDARARRGRRQGPDPRPRQGRARRCWRPWRGFPVNVRYVFEGEEEIGSITSRLGSRPIATGWPPTRRSSATRVLRGQPAGHHVSLRGMMYLADRRRRAARRPPLGRLRRRRPEPGQRARPDHRRAQGPDGRIRTRLLRRGRRAHRGRSARRSPSCRSTRRRTAPRSACRRWSARPATRRSSAAAPARRSTSTASGAASRARAPRRSSRPTPTPRSAAGWSPTRTRDVIFERLRDFVLEVAPPGVTVDGPEARGGRPA